MGDVVAAPFTGGMSLLGGGLSRGGDKSQLDFNDQLAAFDPGARPEYAQYTSQIDPATGLLKQPYQMADGSAWQALANQQQDQGEMALKNQAAGSAAGANATATSQLASRYGLHGGSAERLAKSNQRNLMTANQNVAQQGLAERNKIGLQANQMGRESQQFNIQQALAEQQRVEAAKMAEYQEKMKTYAAGKQAQATFAATRGKGEKGGLVGGAAGILGK